MKKSFSFLYLVLMVTSAFAQFEWAGGGHDVDKYIYTQDNGHIIIRSGYFTAINSQGETEYEFPDFSAVDTVGLYDVMALLHEKIGHSYAII
jgi:hypothetical protein